MNDSDGTTSHASAKDEETTGKVNYEAGDARRDDDTSASNSSSAIVGLSIDGPKVLKPADENVGAENGKDVDASTSNPPSSVVPVIAGHYNAIEPKGLEARSKSRIFYMRNFNNWIKSVTIAKYLTQIQHKKRYGDPVKVLDLGCGKGGDLIKWKVGRITHLLCADVAETSIEQCKERYSDMMSRNDGRRGPPCMYTAEFIHADCTKERLRSKYKDPSIKLDLVSCQFAFHYCFESLQQADMMVRNAAESLSIGGFFIGTIPDANEIVKRLTLSDANGFGNSVYNVTFECPTEPLSSIPLFGAKYYFHLEEVVSCPEFLVHFPTFVRLAERHGLKLVSKQSFAEIYKENCTSSRFLLQKMTALETYPPMKGYDLLGDPDYSYAHAKSFLSEQQRSDSVGTLSKDEWEASSVYLAFAFQKVG
ncbi:mRNA cap guanine-N7 methyltransferase [Ischnura elegans]|uniref:mRNA cap guanine-N7 methyltransferase n=1 Tax=Ischnura elegans TaxID=197161 RepID=UPI001ED8BE44|nr:mRNA cap guanine-N7 methyltransferase [Ischnura elegans]